MVIPPKSSHWISRTTIKLSDNQANKMVTDISNNNSNNNNKFSNTWVLVLLCSRYTHFSDCVENRIFNTKFIFSNWHMLLLLSKHHAEFTNCHLSGFIIKSLFQNVFSYFCVVFYLCVVLCFLHMFLVMFLFGLVHLFNI